MPGGAIASVITVLVVGRPTAGTTAGAGSGPRLTRSATVMPSGAIGDCGRMPSFVATSLVGQPVDASPSSSTSPACGLQQPGERAQQRRLAAGVGADDARDLPRRDRDRQVLGDLDLVVGERAACAAARRVVGAVVDTSSSPADPVGAGEQPQQVRRADDAGDDADRQLGRREQRAGRRGRTRAADSAPSERGRARA